MRRRVKSGMATQVGGSEKVRVVVTPMQGQMRQTGLSADEVQCSASIERHPDLLLAGVKNPEPANSVDEEEGTYKGVFSERIYRVDDIQPGDEW